MFDEYFQEQVPDGKYEHMKSTKVTLHKDGPIIKEESARHNEKAAITTRRECRLFLFRPPVLNFMYESNSIQEIISAIQYRILLVRD